MRGGSMIKAVEMLPPTNGRAVAFTELGVSGLQMHSGRIDEEFLRSLRGLLFIKALREMSENDDIIGAMLFAIEMLLRQVTWTVEAAGESSVEQEAAEFLQTNLDDMEHTWDEFLSEWLACPIFGFAPFEVVLKKRVGNVVDPAQTSRYTDGKIGVRKLAIRHPDTLIRW